MAYYKKRRRRSGSDIVNIIVGLLVCFLVIGFVGSLFGRSVDSTAPDPIASSASDPTVDPDSLIVFWICDDQFQCEEGMTWGEFVSSTYNADGIAAVNESGSVCFHGIESVDPEDDICFLSSTQLIDPNVKYYCADDYS